MISLKTVLSLPVISVQVGCILPRHEEQSRTCGCQSCSVEDQPQCPGLWHSSNPNARSLSHSPSAPPPSFTQSAILESLPKASKINVRTIEQIEADEETGQSNASTLKGGEKRLTRLSASSEMIIKRDGVALIEALPLIKRERVFG